MPPNVDSNKAHLIVQALTTSNRQYRSISTSDKALHPFSTYDVALSTLKHIIRPATFLWRYSTVPSIANDLPLILRISSINVPLPNSRKSAAVSSPLRNKFRFVVVFRDFSDFLPMRYEGTHTSALSVCVPVSLARVFPFLYLTTLGDTADFSEILPKVAADFVNCIVDASAAPSAVTVFAYSMRTVKSNHYLIHFYAKDFAVSVDVLKMARSRLKLPSGLQHYELSAGASYDVVPIPFRPINDGRLKSTAAMFLPLLAVHLTAESGFRFPQVVANFADESTSFFLDHSTSQVTDLLASSYKAACIIRSYVDPGPVEPVPVISRDHVEPTITQRKHYAKLVVEAMIHADRVACPGIFRWADILPSLDVRITLEPDGAFVQILNFTYCPVCQTEHADNETAFHVSTYGLTFRCYESHREDDEHDTSVADETDIPPYDVPQDVRDGTFYGFGRDFQFYNEKDNEKVWGYLGPLSTFAWAYMSPHSSNAYELPPDEWMSDDNVRIYGPFRVHGAAKVLPVDQLSTPFHDELLLNQRLSEFTSTDPSPPLVIQSLIDPAKQAPRQSNPPERPRRRKRIIRQHVEPYSPDEVFRQLFEADESSSVPARQRRPKRDRS